MSLNFGIFKRFWPTAPPNTKIIIGDHRMEIHGHVHIFEVSFLGRVPKLSVIPIENTDTVGFPFAQIIRQIVSYPRPEQGRYPSNRR